MIRKGQYTENFCVLPNALAQHRGMSFEAKGVLAYLLSKPPEWIVRETDLCNEGGCGNYKVRRIVKELIAAKYLVKARCRAADGTFLSVDYEVFPEPQTSIVQKSTVDEPAAGNSPSIKDRLSNTKDPISAERDEPWISAESKPTESERYVAYEEGLSNRQLELKWHEFVQNLLKKGICRGDRCAMFRVFILKAFLEFKFVPEDLAKVSKRRRNREVVEFIRQRKGAGDNQRKVVDEVFEKWSWLAELEVVRAFECAEWPVAEVA
jgi:hypothetical protein